MTYRHQLCIVLILVLSWYSAWGQNQRRRPLPNTEPGILFLKGSSNFNLRFDDGQPLQARLGAGYFIKLNWMAGVDAGYDKVGPYSDFFARPFTRYYAFRHLFGGLGVSSFRNEANKLRVRPDCEAGVALFLDSFIAVEPTVYYLIEKGSKPVISLNLSIFFSRF